MNYTSVWSIEVLRTKAVRDCDTKLDSSESGLTHPETDQKVRKLLALLSEKL